MTPVQVDSTPEYAWIVETVEPHDSAILGPSEDSQLHALAARITADQKAKTGKYREVNLFRCPQCSGQKGKVPSPLAVTYVGPEGRQFILIPSRLASGGNEPMAARVPPKARAVTDLLTGIEVSQCKTCLTYFVLAGIGITGTNKIEICVTNVLESTFGAVQEDGRPSVVHKVKRDGFMDAYIRARQEIE